MATFKDLINSVTTAEAADVADQAALKAAQDKLNADLAVDAAASKALNDHLDPGQGGPGAVGSLSADGLSITIYRFGTPTPTAEVIPPDAAAVPVPAPTPGP